MNRETVILDVPKDLGCYADWDFEVVPGRFALYVDQVCSELTTRIQDARRPYLVMWLLGAGWHRDVKACVKLQKLLRRGDGRQVGESREHQMTIWVLAAEAIYARDFAYYICPACDRRYSPAEGVVHEWEFGESLFAEGGRRFECPQGHTVYALMDWNS